MIISFNLAKFLKKSSLFVRLCSFLHDKTVSGALKSLQTHLSHGVCHLSGVCVREMITADLLFVWLNVEGLGELSGGEFSLLAESSLASRS